MRKLFKNKYLIEFDYNYIGFYLIPYIYIYNSTNYIGIEISFLKWELNFSIKKKKIKQLKNKIKKINK